MSSCQSDTQTSETEDDYMSAISHNTYQLAQPVANTTLERPLVPPLFPPFPPPFDPKLMPIFPTLPVTPSNPTAGEINPPPPILMPPFPLPPLDPNNPIFLPTLSEALPAQTHISSPELGSVAISSLSNQTILPPFQLTQSTEIPATLTQFQPPEIPATVRLFQPPEIPAIVTQFQPPEIPATVSLFQPPEIPAIVTQFQPPEIPGTVPLFQPPEIPAIVTQFQPPEIPAIVTQFQPPEIPATVPFFQPTEIPVTVNTVPQFQSPEIPATLPQFQAPEIPAALALFQPPEIQTTSPLFQPPFQPPYPSFQTPPDQPALPVSHAPQPPSAETTCPPSHFTSPEPSIRPPFQPPNQQHGLGTGEPTNSHFLPPPEPQNRPPFSSPDAPNPPPFPNPESVNQRPPPPPPPVDPPPPPPDQSNPTHFSAPDPPFQPMDASMRPPAGQSIQRMFQPPSDPQIFQGISEQTNRPPISDKNLPPPTVQPQNQTHFPGPETRNRPSFMPPPAPPIRPSFQPPSHLDQPPEPPDAHRFRIPSAHNIPETKNESQNRDPNDMKHFAPPDTHAPSKLPQSMARFPAPPFVSPPRQPSQPSPERFRGPPEMAPNHREVETMAAPINDQNVEVRDGFQHTSPPNQPFTFNRPELQQNNTRPPEPWIHQNQRPQNFPHPQAPPFQERHHSLSPIRERTPERNEQLSSEPPHVHTPPAQFETQSPVRHQPMDHRPPFDMGQEQPPLRPLDAPHRMPFNHPDGMEFESEMPQSFHEPHYRHTMPPHHRPPLDQPFIRPPFHRPRMFGPPPRDPFYPPFHPRPPMRHHRPPPPPPQMGPMPPLRPAWSEHVTPDGRVYHYNHQTMQSVWERPNDLDGEPIQQPHMFKPEPEVEVKLEETKPEIEPKEEQEQPMTTKPINSTPVPGTEWCVVWTNDNKVFFFNPVLNKSVWLVPSELKEHPLARKLMERNPDLPEPEPVPSPVENEPKRAKIEPEVVKEEEKCSSGEESDVEVSKDVEIVMQQPIKKQNKKAKENKSDDLVSDAEAKMLRSTRPLEERIAEYKEMLLQRGVSAFSTWEKEQPKVAFDPRYVLLTAKERKSVFEQFTQERIHEEKREKNLKLKQKRDKFFSLLQDAKVGPKTSFHEFMLKWSKEPRFKEIERLKERESLFIEYQSNLRKKSKGQTKSQSEIFPEVRQISEEKDSKQERIEASIREREREVYESRRNQERDLEDQRSIHKRDESKTQYKALLNEMVKDSRTNFKSFDKALRENSEYDEFFDNLSREERQIQFENHQDYLQNKKRLQFQACIDECAEIDYSTGWKKARKLLKQDPRLEAVSSSEAKQETEYLRYMETKSKRAKEEFLQLLRETRLITHKTGQSVETNSKCLREIHELLAKDRRYLDLECVGEERSRLVLGYIADLSEKGTPPPPTATSPNRARLK